jgi:hypothetical protein
VPISEVVSSLHVIRLNFVHICEFWGFHGPDILSRSLLGCDVVYCFGRIPTFRDPNFHGILPQHYTTSQPRRHQLCIHYFRGYYMPHQSHPLWFYHPNSTGFPVWWPGNKNSPTVTHACRKRRLKWVATLRLGDINTEAWPSGMEVGRGANNPTL